MPKTEPAKFYLDKIQLPVTPATVQTQNADQTEVVSTMDGNPVTIMKVDGADTLSFEFLIPRAKGYYTKGTLYKEDYYYTYLKNKKKNRQTVVLTILRPKNYPSTNKELIVQSIERQEGGDYGDGIMYSVSFVDYHPAYNYEIANNGVVRKKVQ